MIDPDWLKRVLRLSGGDAFGKQPAQLARLLDQPEEVLPYLMGNGGFADWPGVRMALAKVMAAVPRATPRAAMVQTKPADWTDNTEREELFTRMHAMVVASAPPLLAVAGEPRRDAENLALLIHTQRRRRGLCSGPSSFIGGVFAGEPCFEDSAGAATGRASEAIGSLFRLLVNRPTWWRLMPLRWRRASLRRLAERQGLFDSKSYLTHNPDVANAGMDPLQHYMFYGCIEGRSL